jgi:hypothetical protein
VGIVIALAGCDGAADHPATDLPHPRQDIICDGVEVDMEDTDEPEDWADPIDTSNVEPQGDCGCECPTPPEDESSDWVARAPAGSESGRGRRSAAAIHLTWTWPEATVFEVQNWGDEAKQSGLAPEPVNVVFAGDNVQDDLVTPLKKRLAAQVGATSSTIAGKMENLVATAIGAMSGRPYTVSCHTKRWVWKTWFTQWMIWDWDYVYCDVRLAPVP